MMEIKSEEIHRASSIELHYWFDDASHIMDAFVQHRCEAEFLGIVRIIANTFKADIKIETEPLNNGGLRRWFKITAKEEGRKAVITTAIVTSLVSTIIITPLHTSILKLTEGLIEKVFEDKNDKRIESERKGLEVERMKLENEKLRRELDLSAFNLGSNVQVVKRRSNFYEALENYPKVIQVSLIIQDKKRNPLYKEHIIQKKAFEQYILSTDLLEPMFIDDAVIEIISPVLKKGRYQWRGIYNGETHSFNMKSAEFKNLVQSGQIEFKNGTSIKCLLQIDRKMDEEGNVEVIKMDILRVDSYFDNENPIETPEGKKHRQTKLAESQQPELGENWGY